MKKNTNPQTCGKNLYPPQLRNRLSQRINLSQPSVAWQLEPCVTTSFFQKKRKREKTSPKSHDLLVKRDINVSFHTLLVIRASRGRRSPRGRKKAQRPLIRAIKLRVKTRRRREVSIWSAWADVFLFTILTVLQILRELSRYWPNSPPCCESVADRATLSLLVLSTFSVPIGFSLE